MASQSSTCDNQDFLSASGGGRVGSLVGLGSDAVSRYIASESSQMSSENYLTVFNVFHYGKCYGQGLCKLLGEGEALRMGKPDPLCFVAFCSQPQPTALLAIPKLDGPKQVRGSRICYRKSCESRMVTVLSQQPILIGYSLDASVPVTYPAVRLIRSPDDDTQLTRGNNQTQPKSASVARGITYLL